MLVRNMLMFCVRLLALSVSASNCKGCAHTSFAKSKWTHKTCVVYIVLQIHYFYHRVIASNSFFTPLLQDIFPWKKTQTISRGVCNGAAAPADFSLSCFFTSRYISYFRSCSTLIIVPRRTALNSVTWPSTFTLLKAG